MRGCADLWEGKVFCCDSPLSVKLLFRLDGDICLFTI